ncbi:MAG TPA: NAD(P)-binding domain-containing protein [Candidatus Limnocylindrales bacterium]|nr:NAD(P)-binding domain-containing protein [Candidatus Limnocylindrales bacterium]
MKGRKLAIVGAGPIGLEAALRARQAGFEVTIFESRSVADNFRSYGSVPLFTPFHMNSTELGCERLRATGALLPAGDETLTAEALRERYLLPLSRLPEMKGVVLEGAAVTGIARDGPFVLRIDSAGGSSRLERADVVIDASGVYGTPNATGPGGLPALGEEDLGERLEQRLPALSGDAAPRYAGKRILLLGDGRSAANAIDGLDEMVRAGGKGAETRIEWVHRDRGGRAFAPVPATELEELPVLRELDQRVERIAHEAPWIRHHAGATVTAYRGRPAGAIEVTLESGRGVEERIEVARVLALVGYRPDLSIFRELQIHLCYTSEGPMALAAAILAAQMKDPHSTQGCLGQVAHGPGTLKSPEPDFYILGAKSYGRNPNFLLTLGHQQIEDVMGLIGVPEPRLNPAAS